MTELDRFTTAYLETALWASVDDDGEPLDATYGLADFAPTAIDQAKAECWAFQSANRSILADLADEQTGHDFWLTRCRHGAGFWDGDYPEPIASILTQAIHDAGERNIIVGDDGLLYFSP